MDPYPSVNYLAVIVATLGNFAVGMAWYGLLFGKRWISAMGWDELTEEQLDEKRKQGGPGYVASLVGSFIAAYMLALIIAYAEATLWWEGGILGLATGVAFVATSQLTNTVFEGRPLSLWGINVSYNIVWLTLAGVLIAVWP